MSDWSKADHPARAQPEGVPRHVAIIMDGNGRWASARGLPRLEGHRRGVEALRRTVTNARHLGIRYLTVYSFSSENWRRPAQEVSDLMGCSSVLSARTSLTSIASRCACASSARASGSRTTSPRCSTRPRT